MTTEICRVFAPHRLYSKKTVQVYRDNRQTPVKRQIRPNTDITRKEASVFIMTDLDMIQKNNYVVPPDFRCCSNCFHYQYDGEPICLRGNKTYGGAYVCRDDWKQHPAIVEKDGFPAWSEEISRTEAWLLLANPEKNRFFPEETIRKKPAKPKETKTQKKKQAKKPAVNKSGKPAKKSKQTTKQTKKART